MIAYMVDDDYAVSLYLSWQGW